MEGSSAAGLDDLIADVLAGRRRSVARAMSLAESTGPAGRNLAAGLYGHTGRAHVIGLTGVPGSGKSTMVRVLAQNFRKAGRRIGIVAVDPSSPFSGGAILGDRIRMLELAGDPGIFIRSMATRGALGGLARASLDVGDIFDAAGYDTVLIETVGVGQDEVDIVQAAHTVIVVSAPGLGDEIQAIKAGVLEIADIHVVSKCDRPEAAETVVDLKTMLRLGENRRDASGWKVPVLATSAQKRVGMEELVSAIDAHRAHLETSGEITDRRRRIAEMRILKTAEEIVRERIMGRRAAAMELLVGQVAAGRVDPYTAAHELVDESAGRG
ncbi:MAG: methylmalonyl Co-A mutase-associated GTPase MeaB [Rhodospirillales bacterium]